MVQSHVVLVALWIVAGLATIWALGPILLFLTPFRTFDTEVRDDPRETEPRGKDPDYDRQVAELKALGLVPIGKTIERSRFFTPLHWLWVSSGSRWFASPDRKVYVSIHRLAGGHPQRIGASTVFEGGGLLSTSTTPTGLGGEVGERYRRVEIGAEGADELLRQHARHVDDFSRDAGLRAKPATLAEVGAEMGILSKPYIGRGRLAGLYAIAVIYLMPFMAVMGMVGRVHRAPALLPAFLCVAALFFAVLRLTVLPEFRRIRWLGFAIIFGLSLGVPFMTRLMPRHRPAAASRDAMPLSR
jgi:hypothetical protein